MNMVANLKHASGSIRKTVNSNLSNGITKANSTLPFSFREKLDAIAENESKLLSEGKVNLTPSIVAGEEMDAEAKESINKVLDELETFIKEEVNLSDFGDVFLTLPPELVDEIKVFITGIQNGEMELEVGQGIGMAELSALLLVATRLVEEKPDLMHSNLQNLLKQLKMNNSEVLLSNLHAIKEQSDLKTIEIIQKLMQTLESKISFTEKPLTESQSRLRYLQTVHSRYFSTPKGIESSQTDIPDKFVQKTVSTSQVIGSTNEVFPVLDVSSSQLSKVQQFTIYVDQTSKPLPNQQQFINQFQNILSRSSFLNSGGQQKLLINLYPEHLGSLRIEILQNEAGMIARILASTSQAKELVESQLTNLKHSFLAQNIQVEKIEVSTQLQYQTDRNNQRESEQQQKQQSGRQQKEQNNPESIEDVSFTSALLEELVNIKV